VFEFRNPTKVGAEGSLGYLPRGGATEARTSGMTSDLLPRSAWNQSDAQPGPAESQGPRGAGWVIAALYIFCAVVLASWFGGWGENSPQTAAPPAQHHSTHAATPG
jgi:hypothetical protein